MQPSVEVRAATVEEAVQQALAELGVDRSEAVVEVLSEGRRGLFSGGRRAHVRVTASTGAGRSEQADADRSEQDGTRVTSEGEEEAGVDATEGAKVQDEERDAGALLAEGDDSNGGDGSSGGVDPEAEVSVEDIDAEADLAADFLEGLLDLLDLPGDIEIEVAEAQATVTIQDVGSGLLIGRRGATLDALQELVRCAVQRQTERRSHVRVDVEGYRARHIEKLRTKCRDAIAQVRETGQPVRLEPMDAYERKLMHDVVARTRGVTSESEGSEPRRRVVIRPDA